MNVKQEVLKRVKQVPPLPDVVVKLRRACQDPDASYAEIARIIEKEPALTANLLHLANSAYFGCAGSIGTVQLAMTRLGLKRVYQLALTVCLGPLAGSEVRGYDLTPLQMWEHAMAVAVTAELLAGELGLPEQDEAYTAGLLHDIGKVVLGNFVDVDITAIRRLVDGGTPFDRAEREVLGTSHPDVGSALLRRWQIPEAIVEAVRWHHAPARCGGGKPLVDLVHLADILALNAGWGVGRDAMNYALDEDAARRIGYRREAGERVMAGVQEHLAELLEMFAMIEGVSHGVEHPAG